MAVALDDEALQRANTLATATLTTLQKQKISEVVFAAIGKTDDTRKFRDPAPGRTEEMYTLFDVSRFLAEVLDPNEVLNRVVEAARRVVSFS